MELTKAGALWHPHLHLLLFSENARALGELRRHAVRTWQHAAQDVGAAVGRRGVEGGIRETADAICYVTKARIGNVNSPSSLAAMLGRAAQGDADAVADREELERHRVEHPRMRWRFSWLRRTDKLVGSRKSASPARYSAPDGELARLAILPHLGVRSKRGQSAVLGVSTATIGRQRALFPDGYFVAWDARIAFHVVQNGIT